MITTFEIGKTYITQFACDADTKITAKVLSRTAKMVTVEDDFGKVTKHRVSEYYGSEQFRTASYSMAPIFSADRPSI